MYKALFYLICSNLFCISFLAQFPPSRTALGKAAGVSDLEVSCLQSFAFSGFKICSKPELFDSSGAGGFIYNKKCRDFKIPAFSNPESSLFVFQRGFYRRRNSFAVSPSVNGGDRRFHYRSETFIFR